jgi:hypothetical protein
VNSYESFRKRAIKCVNKDNPHILATTNPPSMLTTIRLIRSHILTMRHRTSIPHRTLRLLMHIPRFLLVILIRSPITDIRKRHIRIISMMARRRLHTRIPSTVFLGFGASTSVQETRGEAQFSGRCFFVAKVMGVGFSGAAAAAEEPEDGGEEDEGGGEPGYG